jgi:hypothetical protein
MDKVNDVTIVISRKIKPGCEKQYDDWLRRYLMIEKNIPGYVGTTIITQGGTDSAIRQPVIYAVPRGIPVFRFHIPIIPGHIYQRMIIEYETWTDYSVLDKVIKKLGVLTCCIGIILN